MFKNWEKTISLLRRGESGIESYAEDTMMRGNPDAVLRARDIQEIKEALRYCFAKKIPVTFCGSQTSMTGASVATEGLLISTERLERIKDIHTSNGRTTVTSEPGITVAALKKEVSEQGWFYPPAPTSQEEARIGATVSTNATGEDSFQYGTTRKYVRELKILTADGSEKVLTRARPFTKDTLGRAGYCFDTEEVIDFFIGGEGTLGFIYEVTLDLLPLPSCFFSGLAPFPSVERALDFVLDVRQNTKIKPRALELIDSEALKFMQTHPTFPQKLVQAKALIYFKQEYAEEAELNLLLGRWLEQIETHSGPSLTASVLVAAAEKQKEEMRRWRHHIPMKVNETYRTYWNEGGGKVGSDWWVPLSALKKMMAYVYRTGFELGIPFMAYAHIGMGHPHVNYLAKTPEEKAQAETLLLDCCRKAVSLGGGVAGEHGIGKIHRNLLPIQWPAAKIEQMRKIKKEWDPLNLLGRGNIF